MSKPLSISVEGCDVAGKSTSVAMLKELLEAKGHKVAVLRGMGTGELGEVVRAKLFSGYISERLSATACCLALLDHYDHVQKLLASGHTVINDRSIGTYYAYNVKANQDLGAEELYSNILNNPAIIDRQPDLVFFIDVTAEEARARLEKIKDEREISAIDLSPIEYYQDVIAGFYEYFMMERYLPMVRIHNNQDLAHLKKGLEEGLATLAFKD